jgi:hypothetical protein
MGLPLVFTVSADILAKKHSPRPPVDFGPSVTVTDGGFSSMWPVLVPIAAALVIALILYLNYQAKQRRRAGFIQMANQLGLTYSAFDAFGVLGYPFALFQRGDGRGIENVVYGDWQEMRVIAFDYWYYDESSDGKTTSRTYYRFDCVLVPLEADCMRLEIGPETFFSKLAGALSFHDQQFESEAFNNAFKVSCADPKFASDLIDARMMQWLLANAVGYDFEVIGNRVLVAGPKIDPIALTQLLGVGRGFVQHVPKVVYSLYPG